jgi:hypothetical protein
VAYRIMITLRFRVRRWREIRRVKRESTMGFEGKSVFKIRAVLQPAVFTKDKII